MKKILLLVLLIPFMSCSLLAQSTSFSRGNEYCHARKINSNHSLMLNPEVGVVHSYDVLKYTLDLDLVANFTSPYPHSFGAKENIQIHADSALNTIVLNAVNSSLLIDSVGLAATSFSHSSDMLTLQLDRTYNEGEIFEVRICYHHKNVADGAIYVSTGFFFTDCEPEGARKWFPCFDSPSDKAKTDIKAKVPVGVRLGSNGKLNDSVVDAGAITYHWVSRDPVATYLVVLTARTNYLLDVITWISPISGDTIPFRFYYNQGEDPGYIESIIGEMTTYYSENFGDHPFEKNGFATLNNQFAWGGMENQSLTSLCPGCWGESLVAHEFAHQWFGDMITCKTWGDIFLNEGFATWTEAYWTEHVSGYSAYMEEMKGNADYYLSANPGWAISEPDWTINTPSVNTLFNYAITYMKGSCVLHQLRYVLGDSLHFAGLYEYANDTNFKYKSADIPGFQNKMEEVSGQDLNWFFDEWIYKANHPSYKNVYSYKKVDNKWQVLFTARQQQANIYYWQMPLELKINFMDLTDTVIRVFNSFNGEIFSFEFDKQPANLVFDPDRDILLKQATTIVGLPEDALANDFELTVNPTLVTDQATVKYYVAETSKVSLDLVDLNGKVVRKLARSVQYPGYHQTELDCNDLAKGVYIVRLTTDNQRVNVRFIRQ
ncbi:MAG: T9SS type A sorting domain-containing protein [Bacteroidales bacterium]|nr:T9SS type A sorting domain-containing protein [Bacteroidales bacterium]